MKVVAIVFLILLSPIFAMEKKSYIQSQPNTEEQSLIQRNYERDREWEIKLRDLQQEVKATLKGKEDVIASVREDIREKTRKHPLPLGFREELDALLKVLPHPEELLSIEQRRALMGFPHLENLQPIEKALHLLEVFIKKWGSLAAHAELLQLYANQTLWYHDEWISFKGKIIDKLLRKTLLCKDLLKIYDKVNFFYMRENELAESYAKLPKILHYMVYMQDKLVHLFQAKGATLWEIIRYSSLVKEFAKTHTLPESYTDLSTEFFQSNANPLKAYLKETHTEFITFSMPGRGDHSSSKGRSPRSVPISQQSHSPLMALKTIHLKKAGQSQSAPTSRTGSPLSSRTKIEMLKETPEESFIRKLEESFKQPDDWLDKVKLFKKEVSLLLHANSIVDPLKTVVDCYKSLKTNYLSNQNEIYDILTSKALLNIYGQPQNLIPQTLARRASRLKTNGFLCFNMPDTTNLCRIASQEEEYKAAEEAGGAQHGWDSEINETLFFRRLPSNVPNYHIGQESLMSLLESLFGIYDSEPVVPMIIENILFFEDTNSTRKQISENFATETEHKNVILQYLENPGGWVEKSRFTILTAHRKLKDYSLRAFLGKVALGEDSFKRLNRHNFGLECLFSMLTQSSRSLECYSLEETLQGQLNLRRTGPSDLMSPLFRKYDDSPYEFIGLNILYYLPLTDEEIPEPVKKHFKNNNIFLLLSCYLSELIKLQEYFDPVIERHKLNVEHDISEDLQVSITCAQMFGLSTSCRPDTIRQIIQNFLVMTKLLDEPGVTYRKLHKSLRSLEAQCIDSIKQKTSRKLQECYLEVFFKDIIPLKINQLETDLPTTIQPLYSQEDLASFRMAADLCFQRYLKVNDAEDRPINISDFQDLIGVTSQSESFFRRCLAEFSPWANEKENTVIFFAKVIPFVIQNLRVLYSQASTVGESFLSIIDIELVEQLAKESLKKAKLSFYTSFKTLISNYPSEICKFFEEKHTWWINEKKALEAKFILKAWDVRTSDHADNSLDTLSSESSSSDFWKAVSVSTHRVPPVYCQTIECNHPLTYMIQDLIEHADLSLLSSHQALEMLDRLLSLDPSPKDYHKSWLEMVAVAENQFLAIPPNVLVFLRTIGLKPEDEKCVLQHAQLEQFEYYPRQIKGVTCKLSEPLRSPEQLDSYLLRQLWMGSLKLGDETDQLFFDAILDLLLLPSSANITLCLHVFNDPGSIGFASNLSSKGGIFDLCYKVGDHYPLTRSEKWILLFNSSRLLPAKIRLALSSHALPLLHLQWLDSLKEHSPHTTFHPWYIQTLINKSSHLQEFLLTRLSFTFKDIMSALWPELTFVTQRKLLTHDNDIERTLNSEGCDTSELNPVERKGVILETNGQSILPILHEWDRVHMECIRANPLNLDDAATQWVAHMNPADYEPKILEHILDVAIHFTIDHARINPSLWRNLKILADLIIVKAPLNCLKLATSFYTGIPFEKIDVKLPFDCLKLVVCRRTGIPFEKIILDLTEKTSSTNCSYKISKLKGNVELISELIRLFPNVTNLSLDYNKLRSLKPLVSSLQTLSFLTKLNLSNNPIHNPAPLAKFSKLTSLNIQNTGIPNVDLKDLRELIAREKRVQLETIELPETMDSYFSGPSDTTDREAYFSILKPDQHPSIFLEMIRKYMTLPQSLENTNKIICILEWLAEGENNWSKTLDLEKNKRGLPCDILFTYLREFDPREVAYKLLFAIKYNLPHGTNPTTLSFVKHRPSMQAKCLSRLDVSDVNVGADFLKSLDQFENLSDLSLVGTNLVDLDNLPTLRNLKVLDLRKNKITSLTGLHTKAGDQKFPELTVLRLAQNEIVSDKGISYLNELIKLTYLNISYNSLTTVPPLLNLLARKLEILDLRNNNIPSKLINDYKNSDKVLCTPQRK